MSKPEGPHGRKLIAFVRVILVLIISISVAAVLVKTQPKPSRQTLESPAPLVEVIKAGKTSCNMIIRSYGTVRSGENLALTAEVKGKIVEMAADFEEGNYFPEGSFLIRIDPRNYRLSVDRLKSEMERLDAELAKVTQDEKNLLNSLKIAGEDLALTKAEYNRNLALAGRKVVSQTALDQTRQKWLTSRVKAQDIRNALALIEPRMDLIRAQRQSVLVQLQETQLDLERTEIRTPFDCRVARKLVETGRYVTAGTEMANIYNVGVMEIEARIPPQDVVWLHFNSGGAVDLRGTPPARAQITFDANGQKISWPGFLSRIKGQMEESTRTLPVVVTVENDHPSRGHPIMPGMFVSVEIQGKRIDDVFLLPQEAVHEDNTVYVVNGGEIFIKSVRPLRRLDNLVIVKEGIADGDQVVTRFPGVVSEGMKVRVKLRQHTEGAG
jgi:RND family efflux transporter MFP subunit